MLERCVTSIVRGSRYKKFEILVLDRGHMPPDMEERLTKLGMKRISYDSEFNWSRVNNLGAGHAIGEHLLFLNDDTEVLTPTGWVRFPGLPVDAQVMQWSESGAMEFVAPIMASVLA